ncbi:hypothetical protein ACFOPX_01185 [Helicobacter baculiformis]|uniref:Uncharacterized protein n=1 Tax=Helicobacter baculiformis TaxID=427351 RepID=A0ABV7ZG43_9HELI|nr:hypothetical protein [Helicobacter baculiformis]
MLNPISALLSLQQLQNLLKDNPQHFNATLPLLLKVLEKKGAQKYLLQLGNQIVETKSQKPLIVGQNYWALMQKSSVGAIMLSNLTPQPKIVAQLKNAPLTLEIKDLPTLLSQEDFKGYKETLIQHLTHATTKQDFLLLGNLLLSLQHQVASFVIRDNHKEALLQFKPKKAKQQRLDFYALYPHLGPLQGSIIFHDPGLELYLNVAYESVRTLLQAHQHKLRGFENVHIATATNSIEPLFDFEESLLDTRG